MDRVSYTETKKIRLGKMSAIEDEREIVCEEFDTLSKGIKADTRPLYKTRHTFDWGGLCFEIDVYPEWHNTSVMEVELEREDMKVVLPPFIRVIEEVTGNKAYTNFSMAKKFPTELQK